jgi:hypothetical protein
MPDLKAPMPPGSAAATPAPIRHGRLNGGQTIPGRGGSIVVANTARPILGTEASATLASNFWTSSRSSPRLMTPPSGHTGSFAPQREQAYLGSTPGASAPA